MKKNNSKYKILIIDDDSQIRNHLRASLMHSGFEEIVSAATAAEGLSQYAKESPDVTFLDINLPDADGVSILSQLLKRDKNAYIVMLSGDSTLNNVKKSIESGAKGFVVKPFSMKKIMDSLSGLLS